MVQRKRNIKEKQQAEENGKDLRSTAPTTTIFDVHGKSIQTREACSLVLNNKVSPTPHDKLDQPSFFDSSYAPRNRPPLYIKKTFKLN